jgi:hypothetical protein
MKLRQARKLYRKAIQGYLVRGSTWQRLMSRIDPVSRKWLMFNLCYPSVGVRERMRQSE